LKEAAARKKNNEELAKEALLKDTEQNINDNKKSFNLFKSKKAPTTAAGKVLNVGGGALAAAAAAYIGATLTSKLVTSLYD